jgi:hypothetical protein
MEDVIFGGLLALAFVLLIALTGAYFIAKIFGLVEDFKKENGRKFRVFYCFFLHHVDRHDWGHDHLDVEAETREEAERKAKELLEARQEQEGKDHGVPPYEYYNFQAKELL